MFRTILNRERIYSDCGSPIVEEFKIELSDEGDKLIKSGEYNIYDKIQSYRASCDLKMILDRYLRSGDESVLNQVQGFYMDTVGMPKERIEWLKAFNTANEMFYKLPTDIRSKFDNDPNQFFVKIGTEEFNNILSKKENIVVEEVVKEVKENE